MLHRKPKQPEPFAGIETTKLAYDLSNVEPENYRKEIKNYLQSLYPFLTSGLQYVNYKKPPDEEGNAIGFIEHDKNGVKLTIPIIIEEKTLKEPTIAIYNGRTVPLDKEYLEYVIDTPEYGEQVKDDELPADMQYITQSGLFQSHDAGCYKNAEQVVGVIYDEDRDNPYHYSGSILKKAANNTISVEENVYHTSSEMLKTIKAAEDYATAKQCEGMSFSKKATEVPVVQKISDTGRYSSVMIGGKIRPAMVFGDLFRIEGGDAKTLVVTGENGNMLNESPSVDAEPNEAPAWGYGDAYGTGFQSDWARNYDKPIAPQEASMRHMVFERAVKGKDDKNRPISGYTQLSIPYYVDMVEDISYGDTEKATVIHAKSLGDGSRYKFIITDKVGDIKKVDAEKLKNSGMRYLYSNIEDAYLVPATYDIKLLGINKQNLDSYKDGYTDLVKELEAEYPNKMSIIDKGAGIFTINVESDRSTIKHADVSSNAALLIANYYTGNSFNKIASYKANTTYAFKGDIDMHAPNRDNVKSLNAYRGEYRKLAENISGLSEEVRKVADISPVVDDLVGIDSALDDENVDTTNVLQTLDNVIGRVGELLLMSRLGKNDISESILARALHALVRLSNELRGMANTVSM